MSELINALRAVEDARAASPRISVALEQLALDELISLLSATELSDSARLVVLQSLSARAGRAEVAGIARVTRRQRARVALPTVELLARIGGPEAIFALSRSLGSREDDVGEAARSAGARLAGDDEAIKLVRDDNGESWTMLEPRELAFAVLVVQPPILGDSGKATAQALETLDAEARDALQGNSQSDHDSLVRDAVYDAVLANNAPVHPAIRERAEERLFRRPAAQVQPVLQATDDATRLRYIDRSLRRENRERRPDRVLVALAALTNEAADVRIARHQLVLDCLAGPTDAIRTSAAMALLEGGTDSSTLQRIMVAAGQMGGSGRAALYRALNPAPSVDDVIPVDQIVEWVAADNTPQRRAVVLKRLPEAPHSELGHWLEIAIDDESAGMRLRTRSPTSCARRTVRWTRRP